MAEEKKGFMSEFKEFIAQGNVMDLAVGIIIGGAFTAIVSSLVDDLIMPIIGMVLGGVDFSSLSIDVGSATLTYGMFIQAVINFLLIALVIFLLIRGINKLRKEKEVEEEPAEEGPSDEVLLLQEIRDELKKQ